jgi:hypothetical protein
MAEVDINSLTEEQVYEAMVKVDKTGPGIAKSAFIVIKCSFVIFQTLKAAKAWNKSNMPMTRPVQLTLILSCFILAFGAAYKFTHKKIAPLFLLQSLGNYCSFCVLHVLVGYVQNKKSKEKRA